jgi:hypothetical protein
MARAEAMVEVLERQVGDLQRRLDEAERERRELQGKALALIEDRRGGAGWWRRLSPRPEGRGTGRRDRSATIRRLAYEPPMRWSGSTPS